MAKQSKIEKGLNLKETNLKQQEENKNYYDFEYTLSKFNLHFKNYKFYENNLNNIRSEFQSLIETKIGDKNLVDGNTQFSMKIDNKDVTMKIVDFMKFLNMKINEGRSGYALNITNVKLLNIQNPFEPKLLKSLDITPITPEFLLENQFMTKEVFDKISKGEIDIEKGFWNTTLEKAVKQLHKYSKVRKLVFRNGKSYIATYYVNPATGDEDETDIEELPDDKNIHDISINGMAVGDIIVDENGNTCVVRRFEKDGKIRLDFGNGVKKTMDFTKFAKKVSNGDYHIKAHQNIQIVNTNTVPTDISKLKHLSHLGGSTGADLYEDDNGIKWVIKKGGGSSSDEQCKQECLTNSLYEKLGLNAPKSDVIDDNGSTKLISGYVDNLENINDITNKNQLDNTKINIQSTFVAHALLANWDVVENDNTKVDVNGNIYFLDNGGSLMFRAQGANKNFSDIVTELRSMRNKTSNQNNWFGSLTDGDITSQIDNLILPKKQEILDTIKNADYLDKSTKATLYNTIEKRFENLEDFSKQYQLKQGNKNKPITFDKTKDTALSITSKNTTNNNYQELDVSALKTIIENRIKQNGSHKDPDEGFLDMSEFTKARGFDNRPVVLSHSDFDELFQKEKTNDKNVLMYRTVNAGHEDSFKENLKCYTGGYGASVYGAGTYFASEDSKLDSFTNVPPPPNTNSYHDSRGYGDVTHTALVSEDFKWADGDSISNDYYAFLKNEIENPKHKTLKDEVETLTNSMKDFHKNFKQNFATQQNHCNDVGELCRKIHSVRDWNENHIHELATIMNSFGNGAKGIQVGQTMRIQLPNNADGTKGEHHDFTFTGQGNSQGKNYNLSVKAFFNVLFDEYQKPFEDALSKIDYKTDKAFQKIEKDLNKKQTELQKEPTSIPNPNMTQNEIDMQTLLKDHQADKGYGLYAIWKGYDGINHGRYRTIFNRSKVIVSEKDI